jgi:hypothetical protein
MGRCELAWASLVVSDGSTRQTYIVDGLLFSPQSNRRPDLGLSDAVESALCCVRD